MRPCSLAAAKPARVRSTISSLSISARALITWKKKRPAAVLVSIESVRLRKFTPRACSSDTRVIRSRTLRPNLSSFQTTSTSPGRSRRSARFNPGRLAFFPLAVSSKTCSHSARNSAFFCKVSGAHRRGKHIAAVNFHDSRKFDYQLFRNHHSMYASVKTFTMNPNSEKEV